MKLFLDDDELDEVYPIPRTEDKGIVVTPTVGKRGEGITEERKEIIANDSIDKGPTEAARIHEVPVSVASKYSNGLDISDPDVRARILTKKHKIEDVATTKLLDTLNLIDPKDLIRTKDKVAVVNSLGSLVDKIGPTNNSNEGPQAVHLHLYAPNQKKESDYEVIDV